MGFDFVRKKACFSFNYETWWDVMRLGVGCGWEPTGTGPPKGVLAKNWPGAYVANDGQLLYARDARRLADVLERVIAAPSLSALHFEHSRISRWMHSSVGRQDSRVYGSFEEFVRQVDSPGSGKKNRLIPKRSQRWFLSRDGKSNLRDFIRFCRGGSFRIY
ncbi:MAG: hypothetical protein WBM14_06110 [Terracidiphilus sp.]